MTIQYNSGDDIKILIENVDGLWIQPGPLKGILMARKIDDFGIFKEYDMYLIRGY